MDSVNPDENHHEPDDPGPQDNENQHDPDDPGPEKRIGI